jgi:transposase-like protein
MPRKPKSEKPPVEVLAPIAAEILDQIVRGRSAHRRRDRDARRDDSRRTLIERALGGELTHHLGYPPGRTKPELATQSSQWYQRKTVLTDDGPVAIEVPRDREGTFEPQLMANTSGASRASTTRSSRCTRAG